MKKIVSILLAVLLLIGAIPALAGSPDNVTVLLDGKTLSFDVPAQIIDNRTMVPLRGIFEALGATVTWDAVTYTATGVKDGVTVSIAIGDNKVVKTLPDGTVQTTEIDVPAQIVGNRTLVPARAISESFDCEVGWDGDTYTVTITTASVATGESAFRALANHMKTAGEFDKDFQDYNLMYRIQDGEILFETLITYIPEQDVIELWLFYESGGIMESISCCTLSENSSTAEMYTESISQVNGVEGHLYGIGYVDKATWTDKEPIALDSFAVEYDGIDITDMLDEDVYWDGVAVIEEGNGLNLSFTLALFEGVMATEGLPFTAKDFGFTAWVLAE